MFGYQKRTLNLFNPKSAELFKLSRTKIERFIECPKCFYLDRRLGLDRPATYPFTLNSAVDKLLKKEFDIHRDKGEKHPLMEHYKIDAIPFTHEKMDEWRENFVGVQFYHKPTNLLIFGAVDDIWQNRDGSLAVVDYKATSTDKEITYEEEYRDGYKRQMEIYQWLLRQNGYMVADTGYFVVVNGRADKEAFDGKLEFDVKVIPHTGNSDWVEPTIIAAHKCLMSSKIPTPSLKCDYCKYIEEINKV